jgi:hypothetical protein
MQEFEISLFQFSNSMFTDKRQFSFKNICFAKRLLILRIIIYQHIYVWEIDHFVIKSDLLGDFSILTLSLELLCYHDNTSCLENIMVLSW